MSVRTFVDENGIPRCFCGEPLAMGHRFSAEVRGRLACEWCGVLHAVHLVSPTVCRKTPKRKPE